MPIEINLLKPDDDAKLLTDTGYGSGICQVEALMFQLPFLYTCPTIQLTLSLQICPANKSATSQRALVYQCARHYLELFGGKIDVQKFTWLGHGRVQHQAQRR
ncbi:AVN_HP_G0120060.mRNA.1.CDS.1 [Saccharomyces cerevisiae]|nr:AVN_HP_G0120060.mRNA.1.CDS.1 [Saccharomyces cerevisiae]CAI6997151.1 AVN_HP_G0120060.mRNA.1.CDS.1 [Saccharomyces cerevisiae]